MPVALCQLCDRAELISTSSISCMYGTYRQRHLNLKAKSKCKAGPLWLSHKKKYQNWSFAQNIASCFDHTPISN